jgi:predicted O-linked N-acetylglucosamine transferase (SPINDLY family)
VNALPSASGQPVTFGSFNNNCKINGAVLDAWARLLLATPGSRLQLLAAEQGGHRRRFAEEFARRGVDAERILFADYLPASADLSQGALLARYHHVDVALDTFPYGGMTTTLDALWMGVPVVSLVGERNLGRAGLSLLNNVGLGELAAKDVDDYVETAGRLAQDPVRLAALRASLRSRLQASPLLDAVGHTRKVEQAFRDMWVDWCARQPKVG